MPSQHRSFRPGWFVCTNLITLILMAVLSGVRTLISYRALALGGDTFAIGIVTAAFAVVPLIVAIPIGRSIDRGHGMRAIRWGTIFMVVAVGICAVSAELLSLTVASILLGLGQVLSTVACQALIPLWSEPQAIDRRFGQLTLAVSTGQFLGFPLAGAVAAATTAADAPHVATTPAFVVMGILGCLAIPFAYIFRPAAARRAFSRREHAQAQQSSLTILRTRGMKPAVYSSLAVVAGMDLLTAYLPVLGQEIGLSVTVVTLLLTARTLASITSRMTLPLLMRTFSRRSLLISATLCSAAPMFLLPFVSLPLVLTGLILVIGFFFGIGQPLSMSWVTNVANENNKAAALSVRLAGNRLGQTAVPVVAGGFAGFVGVGAIFMFTGALLLSAAVSTFSSTQDMDR